MYYTKVSRMRKVGLGIDTIILFETICCISFINIFLDRKNYLKKYVYKLISPIILLSFFLIAIFISSFGIKSILIVSILVLVVRIYYYSSILESIVISLSYYGILIGIDYLLLVIIKIFLPKGYIFLLHNTISGTIIALLCKIIFMFIVVSIRKSWKPEDNLYMISYKEWMYLSVFPIFTIVVLAKILTIYEHIDEKTSNVFLLVAFGLVGLNFLTFYLIHDIVNREAAVQDSRLIQERTKNQMKAFENVRTEAHLRYVLDHYQDKHIVFCYDSGHSNLWNKDIDWLSLYSNRLAAIHLHDNKGKTDEHSCPFSGTMDWKNIMHKIKESSYKGSLTLETEYRSIENVNHLQDFLATSYRSGLELGKLLF